MPSINFLSPFEMETLGFRDKGEVNSGNVITMPDMTMSIPELLDKYSRGIVMPMASGGTYDNADFDDFQDDSLRDLVDVDTKLRDMQYTLQERRKFAVDKVKSAETAATANKEDDVKEDDAIKGAKS